MAGKLQMSTLTTLQKCPYILYKDYFSLMPNKEPITTYCNWSLKGYLLEENSSHAHTYILVCVCVFDIHIYEKIWSEKLLSYC